jgi:drug/metabolite transporter (DMT)-like permease
MLGFLLAFGTAVSEASKDILSKYNLRHVDEYAASFSMHLVQTLILLPLLFLGDWYAVTQRFFFALLAGTFLQLAVILLYMKALMRAEISLTVPLLTLTPLFMLITSPILIGEFPSTLGLVGILCIVLGTYIANLTGNRRDVFAPFRNLLRDQGARYMLIVAFLWSITANIDKVGVEETSPVFWSFCKDALIMAYLIPIMYWRSRDPMAQIRSRRLPLLLVGVLRTASVLSQMFAIQLILVPYVISIKRSSALWIMIYAYFFMGERSNIKARLAGMLCIALGLALVALG